MVQKYVVISNVFQSRNLIVNWSFSEFRKIVDKNSSFGNKNFEFIKSMYIVLWKKIENQIFKKSVFKNIHILIK